MLVSRRWRNLPTTKEYSTSRAENSNADSGAGAGGSSARHRWGGNMEGSSSIKW